MVKYGHYWAVQEKAGMSLNITGKGCYHASSGYSWKPSELEQKAVISARQGNLLAKNEYDNMVKNYIYAVEQSLDNYKFNLFKKNKRTFISQMKNCEN